MVKYVKLEWGKLVDKTFAIHLKHAFSKGAGFVEKDVTNFWSALQETRFSNPDPSFSQAR